jgi:energy-coupling factor transporter ATP-binding protein EcfA2
MVETDAELKAHPNAIMKDCSRSQGYGLRVHETHRPPILGRIAQGRAAAMMRQTLEDLERRDIPRLQAEIAGLRALRGVLERLEAVDPEGVVGIWRRMESAAGEVGALEQAMREALDPEALRYLAEADAHAAQARSLEDQRAALDAPEKDLIIERTRLIENRGAEENAREAAEGRMRAIAAEEARDPIATYRSAVGLLELAGRPVSLASHRAMLERVAARPADEKQDAVVAAEAEAARSRNALAEIEANTDPRSHLSRIHAFLRTYPDLSLKAEELGPGQILLWLIGIVERLEGNELLKHRESIERFRDEARREVKDILVSKLYDRFTRVRSSLKALNERLARHRFSGQIYLFTHKVDPEMRPLHDLARRVAREPERAAELLEGGDPTLDEAVETIRQIFQRAGDTQRFEDYRQYFMFELEMTSETVTDDEVATLIEEGARSGLRFAGRLTDRVGKASGGQKQTPFYVAIAASMAAAHYPNSRGPAEGMGLVCFDEAFSKLDIAATQELIRFFGELNLQILVAAPEEKRTSFMELMETVVNISKAHGEPLLYIESEFIGPRAREELTAANPERIGIEGYRRILEQGAAALPPAAE